MSKHIMKSKVKIAASILSCDFANLADSIRKIENAGIDILHLDVMDGNFVDNLTFGPIIISSIRKKTNMFFDAHLMVQSPKRHLPAFIKAGCNSITIHAESEGNTLEMLEYIKSHNIRAGLAINPQTEIKSITQYLKALDTVLIMTVHPGSGGQAMLTEQAQKIPLLYQAILEANAKTKIAVDGGINPQTLPLLDISKIGYIVVGSYLFQGDITLQAAKVRSYLDHKP